MSSIAISTPLNVSLNFEIAPFHKRLFAYLIDFVIQLSYIIGMQYVLGDILTFRDVVNGGAYIFIVGIPVLLYHLFMEVLNNGQSLGKQWMNIRVMSLEGGEAHIGQYLTRWIFRVFEWMPMLLLYTSYYRFNFFAQAIFTGVFGLIAVIVIAISKNGQRLGDIAARTVVISTKINLGLKDTLFKEIQLADYSVTFPQVMQLSDRDINAIKSVIHQTLKTRRVETANRVANKIKQVLKIETEMEIIDFLEKLLEDYNYLATKE